MNTTKKLSLFIFAFMLVGAGCFGANDETDNTNPEPSVQVEETTPVVNLQVDISDSPSTASNDNVIFKMVKDPDWPTDFDKNDYLPESATESRVLKADFDLDLEKDGSFEYILIYTDNNVTTFDPYEPMTIQYLKIYKWNGAEWITIKEDSICNKNCAVDGEFSNYEVVRFDKGLPMLYVEKRSGKSGAKYYIFGQLPDQSYGDFPIEKGYLNQEKYTTDDEKPFLTLVGTELHKNGIEEFYATTPEGNFGAQGTSGGRAFSLFITYNGEKFLSPTIVTK